MKSLQHDLTLEWLSLCYCKSKEDFIFGIIKGDEKLRLPRASSFIKYHNIKKWAKYSAHDYQRSLIEPCDLPDISHDFESAYDALFYSLQLIDFIYQRKINMNNDIIRAIFRRDLPYQLCGDMIVNRDYNPVGSNFGSDKWSDYNDWPKLKNNFKNFMTKDLTGDNDLVMPTMMRKLGKVQGPPHITGYLYNDSNAPWYDKNHMLHYKRRLMSLMDDLADNKEYFL